MNGVWLAIVGYLCASGFAQDGAVLQVNGRGVEGREPYRGGGKVRFLDARIAGQVIHYDGGERLQLPLRVEYEVVQAAPIVLTSRLGTEYWRLFSFGSGGMCALHTDERIDLSQPGRYVASATEARIADRYGSPPAKGLAGIRGHYYFLIEPAQGGNWLDVTDPPPFFDKPSIGKRLTFTLADLSEYALNVTDFQCTWRPGGLLRGKVTVTDADGESFPVVNAPLAVRAGDWQKELETEWGLLSEPTGWLRSELPADRVPSEIAITGTVTCITPDGASDHSISANFDKGAGLVSPAQMKAEEQGYELPRNEQGAIRETRAIWLSTSDFDTAAKAETLVKRCARARLNTLIPDIFVRSTFVATSDLIPDSMEPDGDIDPLQYLIETAHEQGLEVHPWFCVTYRDANFREWFQREHGVNIDMPDDEGTVHRHGADVHRQEYRDFMVDLMVGVARDYDVDGIHLDYIRSMGKCHCEACRTEFSEQFGEPLTEAGEEDWVSWQRQAIGDIVRRTAEGVREARADAIMSAAVFSGMAGGAEQGQDPAGWLADGWLDIVIPMDYSMQSLQVQSNERQFLEAIAEDEQLVTGLSLYQRSGGEASPRSVDVVREQIDLVRRMGIHGYCLFCYKYLNDADIELLRGELNSEEAVPYFR